MEGTNQSKYEHSIRVAQTGKVLAKRWNVSQEDSIIVGLLHDIGKSLNGRQMLELCARNNVEMYEFEIFYNLVALHGKVSSLLFEREFKKEEPERFNAISHAIANHVAGDENMSNLSKIVFIADNIEPARGNDIFSSIQAGEITTPNECIRRIIKEKRERANNKGRELNPMLDCTLEAIDDER